MHRHKEATTASARYLWSQSKAQETFGSMLDAGNAVCAMCSLNLADATLTDVDANDTEISRPKISECLHLPLASKIDEKLPVIKSEETPTKILALLASLKSLKVDDKCVVFSYWTYTLDLIESALISNTIKYSRIDGQLSSNKRNTAIRKFQEDLSVRVILVSITCGGYRDLPSRFVP
ncbi:hypothetical protein ACMFMF_001958 [Clarireedia jacksonii]